MKKSLLLLILVVLKLAAYSQNPDSLYLVNNYTKSEVYIPMRDGVKLFTIVYAPKDQNSSYPILLNRTPYNIAPYGDEMGFVFRRGIHPQFLREGFIFVFQDLRGRFMSEGTFQHMTPFIEHKIDSTRVDESSDAYDTIEWLIKNVKNNNGRVGMWGISYPGFYATCAAIDAHPALKCVSPQAPISDWFFDDAHHHGAFFLSSMFDFLAAMDVPRKQPYQEWIHPYDWGTPDGYQFFMNLGSLSNARKNYFGDSIAFWNMIEEHPNYDQFWLDRNILPHIKKIKPAVLVVGGWYDAEDLYGTFYTYQQIEKKSKGTINHLVIGPWIHGGWARNDGDFLGNVSFDQKTSLYYRDSIELPFFNYYLKEKGTFNLPEATMFMTGKNQWRKFDHWPPEKVSEKMLYLHEKGGLTFNPVNTVNNEYSNFESDPDHPVPYTEDIDFSMTREYMTDDQRFAALRPDVLVFQTDVLTGDVTLAGPLLAQLKVSTTATDADWVVKLIDVYPGDAPQNPTTRRGMNMGHYQQMVRSEVIRGRFRNSYEYPEPFVPGEVTNVNLELQDVLHCFQKGHRIMIQIQSTWFPLVDRNPQKYVENIFKASADDFIKATHRVYHSPGYPSSVKVTVLEE